MIEGLRIWPSAIDCASWAFESMAVMLCFWAGEPVEEGYVVLEVRGK